MHHRPNHFSFRIFYKPRTWDKLPTPCPRHGLTLAIIFEADAMSQTWSYTSSRIYVLMHVPDMSYTSTHNVADACPRHVLH
ncbi:Killer cell lectin-like receptor subfamily B member 1B allele A [Gossypium arboreum]|uniref:Killer cell lectin-like receptor subfamily B member 1B allele A n=1 Tax=Gossypium arboreum TaxID=29729 RepID=A0A0B0MGH7_GOSAR|nr:Killer cell lectin-like receptor subfamily B member 1B allele A [Gossypium arboreum]